MSTKLLKKKTIISEITKLEKADRITEVFLATLESITGELQKLYLQYDSEAISIREYANNIRTVIRKVNEILKAANLAQHDYQKIYSNIGAKRGISYIADKAKQDADKPLEYDDSQLEGPEDYIKSENIKKLNYWYNKSIILERPKTQIEKIEDIFSKYQTDLEFFIEQLEEEINYIHLYYSDTEVRHNEMAQNYHAANNLIIKLCKEFITKFYRSYRKLLPYRNLNRDLD